MEHGTEGTPTGAELASGREMGARIEYLVRTMAEMEQGLRPMGTLDPVASPLAARRIRKVVHAARRTDTGTRRVRTAPAKVRRSSFSHPSAGVTEGMVIIERGSRTRAYCVRLEQERDRWRIVELAPVDAGLRPAITAASRDGRVPVDEDGVRRSSGPDGTGFSAPPVPGDPGLVIEGDGTEGSDGPDGPDGPEGAAG